MSFLLHISSWQRCCTNIDPNMAEYIKCLCANNWRRAAGWLQISLKKAFTYSCLRYNHHLVPSPRERVAVVVLQVAVPCFHRAPGETETIPFLWCSSVSTTAALLYFFPSIFPYDKAFIIVLCPLTWPKYVFQFQLI